MCARIHVFQFYLSFKRTHVLRCNECKWSNTCVKFGISFHPAHAVQRMFQSRLQTCMKHLILTRVNIQAKVPRLIIHLGHRPHGCTYKLTWSRHAFCLYYNTVDVQQSISLVTLYCIRLHAGFGKKENLHHGEKYNDVGFSHLVAISRRY